MAALDPTKSRVMEFVAAFVIVGFTAMMAFITVAPYFGLAVATGSDAAIIAQHQTTIQNVTLAIVSFLFGASIGTQKKDDALATQATTIATAQAARNPPAVPDIVVPQGDTVTVKAADSPIT